MSTAVVRSLRIPFPKESRTRLKNHFYAFSDTQISGYNLPCISEQATTDYRMPENGESTRIPSHRLSNIRVPKNRNRPEFHVPRNGHP